MSRTRDRKWAGSMTFWAADRPSLLGDFTEIDCGSICQSLATKHTKAHERNRLSRTFVRLRALRGSLVFSVRETDLLPGIFTTRKTERSMSTFARHVPVVFLLCTVTIAAAQEAPKSQPPLWASKPDVGAFEKVENERLAGAQRSIDEIIAVKEARTIDNTLVPYDETIRQINAANYFADLMQQVHPDATFRDHATEMTRKASAVSTALGLNHEVYQALASLDVSKADPATRYYVQRQLLEFRLAGVDKDDATRAQLKKLNDQLVEEQSMFDRNISDGQNTVEVTDPSDLEGMPQDYIDRHKPNADGKIIITTDYPDVLPALKFVKSDKLRRRLWVAFDTRAYPKNRDVLEQMMQTRQEIATLL